MTPPHLGTQQATQPARGETTTPKRSRSKCGLPMDCCRHRSPASETCVGSVSSLIEQTTLTEWPRAIQGHPHSRKTAMVHKHTPEPFGVCFLLTCCCPLTKVATGFLALFSPSESEASVCNQTARFRRVSVGIEACNATESVDSKRSGSLSINASNHWQPQTCAPIFKSNAPGLTCSR